MRPSKYLRPYVPNFVKQMVARQRFGDLRRVTPVSEWGEELGTPVDRWYIEHFLADHSESIRGHALEVKGDQYSSRYGASSVDVIDIDPANSHATIVGDLCDAGTLPATAFDVAVVTQTLQFLPEPAQGIRHLLASLRPGATLLLTVPTLSRVSDETDRWRWTATGLREMITSVSPAGAKIDCVGLGNGLAARAFLFGLSAQDLDEEVLEQRDDHYPLLVGAAVRIPL